MRKNNVHTRRKTVRSSHTSTPALLTLAIAQALAFQAVQAANIEVTSNLDDGTDCTLREAIETVNAGVDQTNGCLINGALGTADAISFGSGVAGSTIVTNGELMITQSVSINSGGVNTTIDANGVGRVIFVEGSTVELDQLTLTGGNSGITAGDADITLTNSTVSGNTGRGISASYSYAVTLTNSTVSDNTGGGIFAYRSSVTLTNSTVSGNTAEGSGGGILANVSDVTLTNSTVSNNTAVLGYYGGGGGIYAKISDVTLSNSTVSG